MLDNNKYNHLAFNEKALLTRDNARTLFHCIPGLPKGDALLPTCEREVNGVKGKYLFAATHLSKSLAFAFSYAPESGEIICNGGIDGTDQEFAIICNASKTLKKKLHMQVWAFSDENFVMVENPETRQYVSTQPLKFSDAQLVMETNDMNDLMRNGLQIYSTEKTLEALEAENFMESLHGKETQEWLDHLVKEKGFIWQNKSAALNVTKTLEI